MWTPSSIRIIWLVLASRYFYRAFNLHIMKQVGMVGGIIAPRRHPLNLFAKFVNRLLYATKDSIKDFEKQRLPSLSG